MNRTLIYIGDTLLDLFNKSAIAITYQFVDIRDLTVRRIAYTSTIDLPLSENNINTLGLPQDVHSNSSIPYSQLTARCISNGFEYFTGIFNLTESQNFIKASIRESVVDVFDMIKSKKLYELNYLTNGAWDASAIDSARLATDNVVAPVINWGAFISSPPSINSTLYLPSYFYMELVRKILDETGYTFQGDILNDADLNDLIMPFSHDEFEYLGIIEQVSAFRAQLSSPHVYNPSGSFDEELVLDEIIQNGYIIPGAPVFFATADQFKIDNGVNSDHLEVNMYATINLTIDVGTPDVLGMSVRLVIVHFPDAGGEEIVETTAAIAVDTDPFDFTATISGINFAMGDGKIMVRVHTEDGLGTINSVTVNSVTFFGNVNKKAVRTFLLHNFLLPDMEPMEVIKDFFVRTGSLMKLEKDGVTVTVKTLSEIIRDKSNVPDWTNKRVKRDDKIAFDYQSYAQSNYFNYDDGEDVTENTGRGNLPVNNQNLEAEDDYYDSPFENCRTQTPEDVPINMAYIPVFDNTSAVIDDFINEPGLKLLTLRPRETNEPSVTFNVSARSDYKVGYFVDVVRTKDTGFQYFIDRFYSELVTSFDKTKLIERDYYLEVEDIIEPPLVVYDSGNYFLVNKIPKFISGVVTEKVEVLRVF